MKNLPPKVKKNFVIADFVCPYEKGRKLFNPDFDLDEYSKGKIAYF